MENIGNFSGFSFNNFKFELEIKSGHCIHHYLFSYYIFLPVNLNLLVYPNRWIKRNWVKKDTFDYGNMSRKQQEILFSNKHSPKMVYLDSLLKNYEGKNSL